MVLETEGFLLHRRGIGENDLLGYFFTKGHGVIAGVIKFGLSRKNKLIVGGCGRIVWSARLETQLGVIHFEQNRNLIAGLLQNETGVVVANVVLSLLLSLLPERVPFGALYDAVLALFSQPATISQTYATFEKMFIKELGYGDVNDSKKALAKICDHLNVQFPPLRNML